MNLGRVKYSPTVSINPKLLAADQRIEFHFVSASLSLSLLHALSLRLLSFVDQRREERRVLLDTELLSKKIDH